MARRMTVTQGKGWQAMTRSDAPNVTIYSKLGTPWSYWVSRNENGDVVRLSTSTDENLRPDWTALTLSKTSEHDEVVGESCDVWNAVRTKRQENSFTFCMTDDGIELWRREVYPNGGVARMLRAIHVERRPVNESEVVPDDANFSLDDWIERAEMRSCQSRDDLQPFNFAIRREGRISCNSIAEEVVAAPWRKTIDSCPGRAMIQYETPSLFIRVVEGPDASIRSVDVGLKGAIAIEHPATGNDKVNFSGEQSTILGETCSWQEPVRNYHGSDSKCFAPDGIILASRTINSRYSFKCITEATDLRRGQSVTFLEAMPPKDLLERIR